VGNEAIGVGLVWFCIILGRRRKCYVKPSSSIMRERGLVMSVNAVVSVEAEAWGGGEGFLWWPCEIGMAAGSGSDRKKQEVPLKAGKPRSQHMS
jgi:hypothetical protein